MTKIILTRHGITQWNIDKKYQGQSDTPLSKEGLEQAEKLAESLKNEKIDAVYSSDLLRAQKTAECIAGNHGLKVNTEPRLREIMFGEWEGLTFAQIDGKWPETFRDLFNHPDTITIPGGESFQEVQKRAYTAFLDIIKKHPDETVVIVSHGGTIGTIFCSILELNLKHIFSIKQNNASINRIEYANDRAFITLLNDTHHLE